MQVIGFNFTKISAERNSDLVGKYSINTNVEFSSVEKEKMDMLKEGDSYKISFKFIINYENKEETSNDNKDSKKEKLNNSKLGEVVFQGNLIILLGKDEPKDIAKALKKKEMPESLREPFLNFIIRKCAVKALDLEDQIGLPLHMPFPQLKLQKKE